MMKRFFVVVGLVFCLSSFSLAAIKVTLISPSDNSSSAAPIHLVASANGQAVIIGWDATIDGQLVWNGPAAPSVDTWIPAPTGTHQLAVHAYDAHGTLGGSVTQITVVPDGLPVPPQNAVTFSKIEQNGNWGTCDSSDCAGGNGGGVYWMAQNQSAPSLIGESTEFYAAGVWENALFFQKLGANNNVHNFLWDFYFQVDSNYNTSAQALEFDSFQFVNGFNYMMGTECDYWWQRWDTWDEATGHWVPSNISCPHFAVNTWHHIQMYTTTNTTAHQYTYVTWVIDGKTIPVNVTGNSLDINWGDNLGVQWQLDNNATGSGYHEWMDNAKLTIW